MSKRLTFSRNGEWGIEGVDLSTLPPQVYGALCKLKDIESAAEKMSTTTAVYETPADVLSDLFERLGVV